MNDITPEHAKWLDDAPKRIKDRVRTSLFDLRTGSDLAVEIVDRTVWDAPAFAEKVFKAVALYGDSPVDLGVYIRRLVEDHLIVDAEAMEAQEVYDPVLDDLPWTKPFMSE